MALYNRLYAEGVMPSNNGYSNSLTANFGSHFLLLFCGDKKMREADNEKKKSQENQEEWGESVGAFLLCFLFFMMLSLGLILAGIYFVYYAS